MIGWYETRVGGWWEGLREMGKEKEGTEGELMDCLPSPSPKGP